ncbi:MAG TPA: DUF1592 domain-containing protein [Polyangiaceae bacterium]|nr:DUF1592 domain-containing protein [Polyangiaceae bacterium]
MKTTTRNPLGLLGALVAFSALGLAGCAAVGPDGDAASANDDEGAVPACETGCEMGLQLTPERARLTCEASVSGPRLLRRLTAAEFEATLKDIFPEAGTEWTTRLSVDVASLLGFSNDASALVVNGSTARELMKTGEDLGALLVSDEVLPQVLPCAVEAADEACATEFVNARGMRLFRRPLTTDEVSRYVGYQQSVTERSDFKLGIKWVTMAMVQSPNAVYRSELGKEAEGGAFALDQYELATQLAYVYTGSTPDAALLSAAKDGELKDKEALKAQAQRLLAEHPRRLQAVESFFFEWLEYGKVRGQSRVEQGDFDFAQQISIDMIDETRLFTDQLVFGDKGTVHDLMTSSYTTIGNNLKQFYGYGEVTADGSPTAVARPEGQGIGILAQGSLLAATAHQDYTSPTLRGLLFYRRFLCNSKPKPPDVVPPIEETAGDAADAKTTRQKFEEHHALGACGKCHKPFEPFGYTMEQFDETGRWRADEDGNAIDTVAEVVLNDGSTTTVSSLEDLAKLVDENDDIENCMSGLLAAYAFSGAGGQHCLAEPERRQLAAGEISIYDYFIGLTQTPHFSTRRTPSVAQAGE